MNGPDSLSTIVEGSIRLGNDMEKLEHLAKHYCPDDYSVMKFQEKHVNMYLDKYNSMSGQSKLHYTGNGDFEFKAEDKLILQHVALWETYISMLNSIGINTKGWMYNPNQKLLGDE